MVRGSLRHCANSAHTLVLQKGDGLLPRQTASRLMTPTDRAGKSSGCRAISSFSFASRLNFFAHVVDARVRSGLMCQR
jgi:hypothetical protein